MEIVYNDDNDDDGDVDDDDAGADSCQVTMSYHPLSQQSE